MHQLLKQKYFYLVTTYKTYNSDSDYETMENGEKRKPWISLSGDDDGNHYVMYPTSEDKYNWEYERHLIIATGIFGGPFPI